MRPAESATVPAPSRELEARILQSTMPETAMSCEDFEEFLTDYLDGFLPAHLYHRWERHAALCDRCTELPGEVVRAIGACYIYIAEETAVAGRSERKNSAGDAGHSNVRRRSERHGRHALLRGCGCGWIRSFRHNSRRSPRCCWSRCLCLTNTVSADGSISGVYSAGLASG